jgi:hypothetical protein
MLLACYVEGLTGVPGRQVLYANPQTVQLALQTALSVQKAEKQERFNESFYANFDNSRRSQSRPPSPTRHTSGKPRRSADAVGSVGHRPSQHRKTPRSANEATTASTRNAQTKAALRCYECEGIGHFARECPTRLNKEANSTSSHTRRNLSERSRRSRSPGEGSLHKAKKGARKDAKDQGNGKEV